MIYKQLRLRVVTTEKPLKPQGFEGFSFPRRTLSQRVSGVKELFKARKAYRLQSAGGKPFVLVSCADAVMQTGADGGSLRRCKAVRIFKLPVPRIAAHILQRPRGTPAQQFPCLLRRGVAHRNISRPPLGDPEGDVYAGGAFKRGDHLQHAVSHTRPQIEHLHAAVGGAEREGGHMASGQIHNMDIVPDAGAVRRVVVGAKDRKLLGNHLNFAAAEAYKLLRTNLMFALPNNNECRVIGITSALRGEGKSTTSVNLAYTIAQTGERVLMIEADMRLPNVAQRLALRPTLGLSDLLAGLCTREEVIQESGMLDNLRIIAAGSIPPNPMELLGSEQMTQQLAELKKEFDFIIFDLPPVNAVADGLVISRLVQGMVVVVRQDYGDRSSLSVAVRRLQYLNVKILGFVMTYSHAEKKAYKYRKYGYGYGYGYYGKKGKSSAADTNDDD